MCPTVQKIVMTEHQKIRKAGMARILALGSMLAALVMLIGVPARAAPTVLSPQVVWVPERWHSGGAYTAIQAGPDGRVYLGTTLYDGFARFLVLPPGGQEFHLVADMAAATGENTPGDNAQAKIHTKPAVGSDGRIWFATKSGQRATVAATGNYPGGHLLSYDPKTGRVTDHGIPRPKQSIIAVGVDRQRYIVYALTDPEIHLITFDPRTRAFADKGQLASTRQPTRYLVVLANGDVYHQQGGDDFMRYNAAAGRIERVSLHFAGRGSYEVPYAIAPSWEGSRFYGVGEEGGQVFTFTPGERGLQVTLHGGVNAEGVPQPGHHYTIAPGPDGHAYYVVEYGRRQALVIQRLNTRTGSPEVVGVVGTLPPPPGGSGRRGRADQMRVEGSTVAPNGTVYVMLAYPLRVLVFPRLARP